LDFGSTIDAGFGPKNNQHPGACVMDGTHTSRFFLEPKQTFQRQYEALRAIFVEGHPLDQVAVRFGYKLSALKSMASRFRADCRRGVTTPFFSSTDADGPSVQASARAGHAPNRPKSPTAGN
jgi:hypothetical protein